ncbi:MAG: hypothetical protein HGA41_03590, partial [Syntrophaceae bacterium]|nr:hypothetical protein [Syntrophaceae bacterium]
MSQEEIDAKFFENIHKMWIEPEVIKRQQAGAIPADFRILRALIRLPKEKPPIVEFNEEISWLAHAKSGSESGFQSGETVFIHDVREIITV